MFALPLDLFTPYIKGREMAIDRNWQDLSNANNVQQGWLNNDAKQLNNWFAQDTYDDRVASSSANNRMVQNAATNSDYATQLAGANQQAALAQAGLNGQYQQALFAASTPYIGDMATDEALFRRGQYADRAAQGNAALRYSNDYRDLAGRNNVQAQRYSGAVVNSNMNTLPATEAARQAGLQYQTMAANANAALVNPNADLTRSNIQSGLTRNQILQNNPDLFFGQQRPQPAAPVNEYDQFASSLNSIVGGLEPGRIVDVNIGGTSLKAGRDDSGIFYINANGVKQYVNPTAKVTPNSQPQGPTPAQAQPAANSPNLFSFGGLTDG